MLTASFTARTNLGFNVLLKDTLTCGDEDLTGSSGLDFLKDLAQRFLDFSFMERPLNYKTCFIKFWLLFNISLYLWGSKQIKDVKGKYNHSAVVKNIFVLLEE